jgi:hypothetical protein
MSSVTPDWTPDVEVPCRRFWCKIAQNELQKRPSDSYCHTRASMPAGSSTTGSMAHHLLKGQNLNEF